MIPVSKPWITEREKRYVAEAMDSGWISSTGPFIVQFEEAFASYVGTKHAVGAINGTAACHLAMLSVGVGPGDDVVVPATTFVATANAARYCGANVRIIDIDRMNWNMDPQYLGLMSENTKAIFFVHLYGNMCDMDALKVASKNAILVEDACEALGGEWKGKRAGSLGRAAAFSFYANKTISTGEGGMLVTDDDEVYEKAKLYRGQGQTARYFHPVVGYNYRMTNIQAAIGLAQLERMDEIMAEKRRVYERYKERLKNGYGFPFFADEPAGSKHSCWAVTISVKNPEKISVALAENGVESRRVFFPICDLPPYGKDTRMGASDFEYDEKTCLYKKGCDCLNARWLRNHGITLPSYSELTNSQIDTICDLVLAASKS